MPTWTRIVSNMKWIESSNACPWRWPLAANYQDQTPTRRVEVLGVPVLLTRSDDGVARAFLNVCKHRGAPLCEEGLGEGRRLTCPYHAWVYDMRGDLGWHVWRRDVW